jgi:hypothetical protein
MGRGRRRAKSRSQRQRSPHASLRTHTPSVLHTPRTLSTLAPTPRTASPPRARSSQGNDDSSTRPLTSQGPCRSDRFMWLSIGSIYMAARQGHPARPNRRRRGGLLRYKKGRRRDGGAAAAADHAAAGRRAASDRRSVVLVVALVACRPARQRCGYQRAGAGVAAGTGDVVGGRWMEGEVDVDGEEGE